MQIQEIDAKQELHVLSSLIYNDAVLAATAKYIDATSFKSRFSFKIAEKCAKHYNRYRKAPKASINDYIENQITNSANKEETQSLQRILTSLEDLRTKVNGKKSNNDYLIDKARMYLNRTKFVHLASVAKDACDNGDFDRAEKTITKLRTTSLDSTRHVWSDPICDDRIAAKVLKASEEPLLRYIGVLGQFFDSQLDRSCFVAFQGGEKSFKSFWLQEICFKSLKSRLKTMFIGIGDMSEAQYNRRFYARLAYRPWSKCDYLYPVSWKIKKGFKTLPRVETRVAKQRITETEINSATKKFRSKYFGSQKMGKYFKLRVVENISVQQIEEWIKECQDLEGWSPDVVIVDYADRISPPKGITNKIDQVEHNWSALRNIALRDHCLVTTATQSKRTAYKGFPQTRDDVSDSKTKTALVTGLIGINEFQEEHPLFARRLNWIVCREHTRKTLIHTAGCPAIGHPCVIAM